MTDYRALIDVTAKVHGLDPDLVEAVVVTESSGNTDAFRFEPAFHRRYLANNPKYSAMIPRRASSSYGLLQVMFSTACEVGYKGEPEGLFVPAVGLEIGCRKLAAELRWADQHVGRALEAYNGGRGSVGSPLTQKYVVKVMANLARVKASRA